MAFGWCRLFDASELLMTKGDVQESLKELSALQSAWSDKGTLKR